MEPSGGLRCNPDVKGTLTLVDRAPMLAATGCGIVALAVAVGVPSPGVAAGEACRGQVSHAVIPAWARTGFTGARPRVPYVLGRSGRIVGILFGYPLRSPPASGRANKILWVSRAPVKTPTALWIRAQRMRGSRPIGAPTTHVVRNGPGPSYLDVPEPGCWRLTLSWAGRADALDLVYTREP